MSKKKGRDFNCPFTSNPYHVCADFCFEKMSEKLQDVGKEPEVLQYPLQNKEMTEVQRKGETPTSLKGVKPFNSCAGNFFSTNTRERMKRIWVVTERSDVHPDCKNATNPYHKCAEYCFKYIPNGEQPGQVMGLNNLEGEKIFSSCGRTSLQSQCMYASNPQDECTNFCFKNGPDSNTREGENPMDDSTNSQESGALPKQLHVSIPCHNGVECFFENTPEQMLPQKVLNPKEEIKTSVASKSEVKLECRNANPFNIYDESCFHSQPEDQDLEAMRFAKDEKEMVPKPEREMNSNCENVSNPYVEYYFKNVPEKNQLGLATKSEEENKIALYRERLMNHECQFTSNTYHTCSEYCFQKAPERERRGHEVLEYPVQNKEMTKIQRKGETPTSLKAVKSFNSCAGNLFSTNTRERMKRIWVITERSDVHPDCKNATNPYHKCAEYCFKYIPNGEQPGQVLGLNNLEEEKIFSSGDRTSLQSQCIYASNPQDECTNFCFKNGPDSNTREGENPMDDSTNSQESGAIPKQLHVSIPCHNGVERFFENTPAQMLPEKALNPKEEIKTSVASKSEVKLECRNANPYNIYDESCFNSQPQEQDLEAMTFAKDEKEVVPKLQREMNSNCENVSNPYVEYCIKNVPEKDQLGLVATKSMEENKIALHRERLVNHECQFTSNPYHTCAEYCFQKALERERRGYVIMKPNKETKVVVPREKGVNPKCQFASNPYHVCAEYCFQNFPEGTMLGHVMKLSNQQELKKAVSHRKISEGVTESKAGKKETSYELKREVTTKCKLVSNPFHKSSECCSERYPDKNQPVKSVPVTTKEKNNRNSLSEKTDHPIMEKSTANLELVEASLPIYNNVESKVAIIFPDQILKNSEDSNLVEESNPDSDYTDFSEGITMEVVAKDLMREVEMRITKKPSDAQPLLLVASGLFLEWANYCSQENEAEDKIFMQVERRAFDTKNGQGNDNLKCNDSSNLAEVKSKSLQSSLQTYVLFFLGFLFALFKWTEVIHSVVMSSERKSSGRLMHKRPVKSK